MRPKYAAGRLAIHFCGRISDLLDEDFMFSNQVHFRLYERPNSFRESGKDWVLSAQFVGHSSWVIRSWENKPSDEAIEDVKTIAMRCFEFYHRHLHIPSFDMNVVDI